MHHVKAEMLLFSTMLITLHVQIGTCDSFCYGGSHIIHFDLIKITSSVVSIIFCSTVGFSGFSSPMGGPQGKKFGNPWAKSVEDGVLITHCPNKMF